MTDKICLAPWTHLHTWPNNDVYPCCLSDSQNPVGNLKEQTLEQVWNSQEMKDMRLSMLKGNLPLKTCSKCIELESHGQDSLRHFFSTRFDKHAHRPSKTNADGSLDDLSVVYWDFRFSNICNMRCRSCGPQLSTGWYEDTKKLWGQLPNDVPDPGKNKNMWEEIVPLFDIVEEIYFAGGEPLIMEEHYRILNKLVDMGKTNVRIRYNTNFSRMQYKKMNVLDVWSKFDSVSVGASLDAHFEAGEYIRKGTIWSDIVKNRTAMIEKAPNADFFITCTVSVLNSFRIINFHKYLVEQGLISHPRQMHLNFVQDPSYLRIQILPQHLKDKLTIEYQEYAEVLRKQDCNPLADNFIALVDYMNSSDQTNLISQFKLRQQQVDVVRNENLIDVLPELAELYND